MANATGAGLVIELDSVESIALYKYLGCATNISKKEAGMTEEERGASLEVYQAIAKEFRNRKEGL